MKKFMVLPGALGVALAIVLSACTSGAEKPDEHYLNIDKVKAVDCKTTDLASLESALTYVGNASRRDILKRNPAGTTVEQLQQELSNKIGTCKKERENNYQTIAEDGTGWQLPMAPENVDVLVGDSTKDPDTPPVMPALPGKCRGAINWTEIRECAKTEQWYIDGINQLKPFSGFNWDDVLKWADAKRPDGNPVGDARLIQAYGYNERELSQADARNKEGIRSLVSNDDARNHMGMAYQDTHFVNTRGLENERVSPFIDPSRQIRVSIAPLVLNEKGEAIQLKRVGGIFVDCLNIWGKAYAIAPAPGKPALCPNTDRPMPPEGPKGCNPPPGTSTTVTTTTTTNPPCEGPQCSPKKPDEAPGQPGGIGDGGRSIYGGDGTERHTATGTPAPPAAGQPPAQYTPPALPTQTQQPAPVVTGTQNPGPTPTVNPPAQPTQTATIPPSQCNNPDFC